MRKVLIVAIFLTSLGAVASAAVCPSPNIFDGIVKVNVDKDGGVDYDAIRVNKGGDLYEFISLIEDTDLSACSQNDRLAFWINAYNAHMIRLVLARPNMKQISEDFKMFGEKFKVAKINLSLNEIEHRVIRASTKKGGPIEGVSIKELDPRVHFVLVFGAQGSPKLSSRAYVGATLDTALNAAAVAFANDPKHLNIQDGKLVVSSLMRWYAEDFAKLGGAAGYLATLTDSAQRPDAAGVDAKLASDYPESTTFRFDWSLNKKNKEKKP